VRDAIEDKWRTGQLLREAEEKRSEAEAAVEELAAKRQGVNFTNILRAAFLYQSFAWNIGAKAAGNMLVKLTQGMDELLTVLKQGTSAATKQVIEPVFKTQS
jgi:hypothetical protein